MRDLRRELDRDTGEYPPSWVAGPGDVLVGTVVRYGTGHTEYGACPTVVIRDEEGGEDRTVWLIHAVLRSEFAELRPKPGERVGIKRLPDDPQKAYKRYAVVVDRDEPDVPDFGAFPAAGDVPPEEMEAAAADARALADDDDDLPF